MTPDERRKPMILNGSRRMRIAKGSGMTVTDVNSLVNRFEQAAKMMKTMQKGGVPQGMWVGLIMGLTAAAVLMGARLRGWRLPFAPRLLA